MPADDGTEMSQDLRQKEKTEDMNIMISMPEDEKKEFLSGYVKHVDNPAKEFAQECCDILRREYGAEPTQKTFQHFKCIQISQSMDAQSQRLKLLPRHGVSTSRVYSASNNIAWRKRNGTQKISKSRNKGN
jgi:hypothetical protein